MPRGARDRRVTFPAEPPPAQSIPGPRSTSTDLRASITPAGHLVIVGPGWEQVLGYTPAELTSRAYTDLVHPEDVAVTVAHVEALFRGELAVAVFENRCRAKDGEYRWLSWRTRIAEAARKVSCLVRDVTEQRIQEHSRTAELERLRRRDLMLTGVLDNEMTLLYVKDLQGRYLLYNRAFAEATGLDQRAEPEGTSSAEVLIGRDDTWLDPTHAAEFQRNDRRALEGTYRVEEVLTSPDGQSRTYESIKFPLSDPSGTVYATCGISLDTTDRTQAAKALEAAVEALRESENHYRLLAENATDVVSELDSDFVVRWLSPSAESVLGRHPDQVLGRPVRDVVHPDDWPVLAARGSELAENATGPALEIRVLASDGSYRWMSVQTRPTTDVEGRVTGTILGLRDVDQQVRARQALAESEHHYRLLSANATDAVFIADLNGMLTWVSPAIRQVLGHDPDDLVGRQRDDWVHPDDLPAVGAVVGQLLAGQTGVPFEVRARTAAGEYRWMSGVANMALDADGSFVGLIGAMRDAHEQVLVRQALAEKERLFRLAMDGAPQGMAVVGLDLQYLQVNEALCAMLGRDEAWMLAHTIVDVIHPDDLAADLAVRDELLNGPTQRRVSECRLRRADGSYVWVVHSTGLLRDDAQQPLFSVSHVQDNTDAHRIREELARRASHDPLTGLINRDGLQARLTDVLNLHAPPSAIPGLLYCDLDHFKRVNDDFGHEAGDEVLRITAHRISSTLRSDDVVARLGGDEFVVLLSHVADDASAVEVAQKIRSAVAEPMATDRDRVRLSVSIGIALATPDVDAHRLLRNADAALYRAKNSGRNQIAVFDHASTSTAGADIREGLSDGQFVPWFQPIVRLDDGVRVGYEALARWIRPDGSIQGPDAFLHAAEEANRIVDVDRTVLRQSCQLLGRLPAHQRIAVNVSAATIASAGFADEVIDVLKDSGVDPSRLHLEFTETALLSVTADIRNTMRRLADLGVRWFVDDFGTGYSSIAHLRDLPIAGLKLDRSFTAGLGSADPTCERLAKALAGLADGLGLDTVAEGIERPEQAAILTAQGWKHGQGWLYAHPAPPVMPPSRLEASRHA